MDQQTWDQTLEAMCSPDVIAATDAVDAAARMVGDRIRDLVSLARRPTPVGNRGVEALIVAVSTIVDVLSAGLEPVEHRAGLMVPLVFFEIGSAQIAELAARYLDDPHPTVRQNAAKVVYAATSVLPRTANARANAADHPDFAVREILLNGAGLTSFGMTTR